MKVGPYYSAEEPGKETPHVYHTHDDCQSGRDILKKVNGKPGGYRLCKHCKAKG
jgi:hypothetical protein